MKKIILSLLMALTIFVIPNISASATVNLPEIPSTVKDYVITKFDGSEEVYYLSAFESDDIYFYHNGSYVVGVANSGTVVYRDYRYVPGTDTTWKNTSGSTGSLHVTQQGTILYNSKVIYTDRDKTDIYSAKKPVPVPSVPLAQTIAAVELGGVMKVTLTLVGLVVSLIVSFLAFRKSWSWLLNLLQQS